MYNVSISGKSGLVIFAYTGTGRKIGAQRASADYLGLNCSSLFAGWLGE